MRKLVSILLLCCLFVNIIGYHIIFYFRQLEIKTEMKKLILSQPSGEDENDFIFSINDKQAQARLGWDGDDEFSFNGDMYDVIEKKIENGMIIIRALADKKETALIQKYSRISGENHSRHKTALLVQLVNSLYLPSVDAISFIKWQFRSVRILLHPVMIVPGVHDVLTPPPRSC